MHDDKLSAMVNWEQCREDDPNLDGVGTLFDLELEANASEQTCAQFGRALRDLFPSHYSLCTSHRLAVIDPGAGGERGAPTAEFEGALRVVLDDGRT